MLKPRGECQVHGLASGTIWLIGLAGPSASDGERRLGPAARPDGERASANVFPVPGDVAETLPSPPVDGLEPEGTCLWACCRSLSERRGPPLLATGWSARTASWALAGPAPLLGVADESLPSASRFGRAFLGRPLLRAATFGGESGRTLASDSRCSACCPGGEGAVTSFGGVAGWTASRPSSSVPYRRRCAGGGRRWRRPVPVPPPV